MGDIVFCKGGGCTAKLGPAALQRVLSRLPRAAADPRLLVGYDASDDAAVYQLTDELAIVQTLDFFPPMVDEPEIFGEIAAANALSDIYAMGAQPTLALNIVAFPEAWDLNILGDILTGGAQKVAEAGALLCGGHSINDTDVKYGLSVTGQVHPARILSNQGARQGDRLILTKALGVGIICTALRLKAAGEAAKAAAYASMRQLNKCAAAVLSDYEVHACTDVTGFGFAGHLMEMLSGSAGHTALGAVIEAELLPKLPEAAALAEDFYLTAAGQRNRNHLGARIQFENCPFWLEELVFDPQTSGGLLVAVPERTAQSLLSALREEGLPAAMVGEVCGPGESGAFIRVRGGQSPV